LSQQKSATDKYVVTSLLNPSAEIRKGYEAITLVTADGRIQTGSLPTALRFAEGKFRSGSDPHAMYKTLTNGFGLMVSASTTITR